MNRRIIYTYIWWVKYTDFGKNMFEKATIFYDGCCKIVQLLGWISFLT